MPAFCRHNHLVQNCPICSREQGLEMRPVVSSGVQRPAEPRERAERSATSQGTPRRRGADGRSGGQKSVRVRQLARGADDGFQSPLVPGLKSSEDADRLAQEIAFAAHRLSVIETQPVGLWAEVAGVGDIEERTWLAFLIAYIGTAGSPPDPFAQIEAARVSWSSGQEPHFTTELVPGPRGAYDPQRAAATVAAYRTWAERAGSQYAAFTGEGSWSAERRFERLFERLALPGLHRDARFELLVTLGRAGVYELRAGNLQLSGENEATWAAKRAFGIGDPILLERRAAALQEASGAPLDALDLALHNWGAGVRVGVGIDPEDEGDPDVLTQARDALGL